ncbi:MAG: hypothetical protein ACLUS6_10595 [Dysosmobacter sp.]
MDRISRPARRPRRRLLPVLLLIAAVLVVGALLTAVALFLRAAAPGRSRRPIPTRGRYISTTDLTWCG